MSDLAVHHALDGTKGRYFITHDSGESALTYSVMSPALVIADHTEVAEGYDGQGIGLIMLKQFIADARANGFKIMPLCPFVNAQRRKHPEWSDAFAA
ncbi:MAG: GNAT family N-acetyltransferase [Pseudomonadota bacterium]